jgi:prevent-host-death family protein
VTFAGFSTSVSVTDAAKRGLSRLVAEAEGGGGIVVERRGVPAAVVVGAERMRAILQREDDLRSAALVLSRAATDNGNRSSLGEVIEAFGFERDELEAELDAERRAADA